METDPYPLTSRQASPPEAASAYWPIDPPALMRSASAKSSSRQPPASANGQASSRCPGHTSPILRTGKGLAFAQNQIQTELKGVP